MVKIYIFFYLHTHIYRYIFLYICLSLTYQTPKKMYVQVYRMSGGPWLNCCWLTHDAAFTIQRKPSAVFWVQMKDAGEELLEWQKLLQDTRNTDVSNCLQSVNTDAELTVTQTGAALFPKGVIIFEPLNNPGLAKWVDRCLETLPVLHLGCPFQPTPSKRQMGAHRRTSHKAHFFIYLQYLQKQQKFGCLPTSYLS